METTQSLIKKIQKIQITTKQLVDDLFQGAYRSVFKGNGLEFEEVRQYVDGDDIRSIDWNVTARMNYPHVKSFCEERELTVFLCVDISSSVQFGTTEKSKQAFIAELAAVLAFSATGNSDQVGLILFSDHVEKYIPPRKGTRHVLRVVRELLTHSPKASSTNIAEAVRFVGNIHPRMAVTFFISDFQSEKPFEKEMATLARHHDLVAMDVVDPREREFPSIGYVTLKDPETGQEVVVNSSSRSFQETLKKMNEEKKALKRKLQQRNIGYINLPTDQAYRTALQKYFSMRERRKWVDF